MGREVKFRGIPAFAESRRLPPRNPEIILQEKKPRAPQELTEKQKKAKETYIALGATPDVKREAGEIAGYHPNAAIRGVNSALRPIVGILNDKGVDDNKVADVIKDGLDAMHPIVPEQKDHHARHKFVREYNQLSNNYPPKQIQAEGKMFVLSLSGDDIRQSREADRIREEHDRDPI